MKKGQLDQTLISQKKKKKKSLQNQNSFLGWFTLWPHKQLYQHNVLWAMLGAWAAVAK